MWAPILLVPLVLTDRAIGILQRFIGQLMVTSRHGFNPTINGFRLELRGWLRIVAERIDVGDQNPQCAYLCPYRTLVNIAYFGLEYIQVMHCFLGSVILLPTGRFTKSVIGLRFQMLAHGRWMPAQVVTPPPREPTPPWMPPSGGGVSDTSSAGCW